MIRYGSVQEAPEQPCAERPLLPRPRASAEEDARLKA